MTNKYILVQMGTFPPSGLLPPPKTERKKNCHTYSSLASLARVVSRCFCLSREWMCKNWWCRCACTLVSASKAAGKEEVVLSLLLEDCCKRCECYQATERLRPTWSLQRHEKLKLWSVHHPRLRVGHVYDIRAGGTQLVVSAVLSAMQFLLQDVAFY